MISPEPTPPAFHYRLFGLTLASEIALPELVEVVAAGADVRITRAELPLSEGPRILGLLVEDEGALVQIPKVGRYRIRADTIQVDINPGVTERNARLFLLGSAIGALLHRRGLLPLHANAIDLGGRAIAVAGRSGAGKSTIAAAFLDRGHRLLSDDICVVGEVNGVIHAQPGIPRVRLWSDAVERSGRTTELLDRAFDGHDKYVVPIGAARSLDPLPLAGVFFLADADGEDARFDIRPLSGGQAMQRLVVNTYRRAYVPLVGDPQQHFTACQEVVCAVPMYELRRPWDASRIPEMIDRLESFLLGISP